MGAKSSTWMSQVLAVFLKDFKSELRTRYSLNTLFMFAVITLTAVSLTVGMFSLSLKVKASLFWIVVFFSAMSGLAQVFVKEEESRTSGLLKLVASAETIFTGKLIYNLLLLLFLEVILVPLFIVLLGFSIINFRLFLCVLMLGSLGLVCATTIIAAIVAKASVKGALFAVLSFPILLPLLIVLIDGTYLASEGASFSRGLADLQVLFSYAVVMLIASFLLFEFVWEE
ncbi:MAG: heme exporter protein CcmB [candidate division Zixibacteria bacterium]|nr:heme exporter protein CcmB [candidate division Zixibacteria bacterium]